MLERYTRILVTGGAGFIGRHLVAALLELGKQVVILDQLAPEPEPALPGASWVRADIRDAAKVAELANAAELIFHLAANANGSRSVVDPRFDFETNAVGTFNVLEAAKAGEVKKLVYVSSASVYGRPERSPTDEEHPTRPFVPYGASKLSGELCCRAFFAAYDLPVVIARPFCVYGPGENPELALVEVSRYLRWQLNRRPIQVVGDLDCKTRDFVHVSDVVQGLLLADRAPAGEVFNLGSGQETSMRELIEVIELVTGRRASIQEIKEISEDTYRLVADITKIKALGYLPKVSLEEGVRQLTEELGEHPELPAGETIFRKGQRAERAG
ncbi:NAD-dependent epimerase/dehydratase family protein [Candidatus Bipolaricaulota bacterium]|nr:NAD-dependent epimerase/dehydratase family protein [Candidatus Bipolaricaulota bacterium]